MNPAFRLDGIYVRTINRQKEIEDYKPGFLERFAKTKIGNTWDRDHPVYEIIYFLPTNFNDYSSDFKGGYVFGITGEIQSLADWSLSRGLSNCDFDEVDFIDDTFSMENKELKVEGKFKEDPFRRVTIKVTDKIKNIYQVENYRFVQWLY